MYFTGRCSNKDSKTYLHSLVFISALFKKHRSNKVDTDRGNTFQAVG